MELKLTWSLNGEGLTTTGEAELTFASGQSQVSFAWLVSYFEEFFGERLAAYCNEDFEHPHLSLSQALDRICEAEGEVVNSDATRHTFSATKQLLELMNKQQPLPRRVMRTFRWR